MRGGPSLKGKGGLVGFRKKTYNPLAFTQKTLIFAQNLKNRRNYGNIE